MYGYKFIINLSTQKLSPSGICWMCFKTFLLVIKRIKVNREC